MMGHKKIYRALAYERVSTKNEDQANSLINQGKLREQFLKRHPEVMLVHEPFSEKESGKSDRRPEYQKMIARIEKGDIDYLLIKDFKRLCRSNELSAQLRHMCQQYDFKLVLTSTNQVYDPNAEEYRLMFGFEALINEELVYRQSHYGKIAHAQRVEAKRLSACNVTFGFHWDKEKKDMFINETEAHVLKMIFEMLVYRNLGINEIRKILAVEYGVVGQNSGNLISVRSLRRWLRDTACLGKFYINKVGTILEVGIGAKSQKYKRDQEEWVLIDRPDLQIIPVELFNLAQRIMGERVRVYAKDKKGTNQNRFQGTHLFSARVFCGKCGQSFVHYYTDRKKTISAYKDSYNMKAKTLEKLKCDNEEYGRVYEATLSKIALGAINGLIEHNEECFDILMNVLTDAVNSNSKGDSEYVVLTRQISHKENEAEKIMGLFIEAPQNMREALGERYENLVGEITKLKRKQDTLSVTLGDDIDYKGRVDELRRMLEELHKIETLDRNTVENFIHKIVINDDGMLDVYLKTNTVQSHKIDTWNRQKELQSEAEAPDDSYIYGIYNFEDSVVKMGRRGMKAV